MKSKRYPITIILFWIITVMIAFLVENVALLTDKPREGMGLLLFIILTIITLIYVGVYLYYEFKINNVRPNILFLIGVSLFFIVGLSVIVYQPNTVIINPKNGVEVAVEFTNREKFIYVLQLFLTMVMLYIFMVPYKSRAYSIKIQTWMYWIYIGISFITVIVSFFTDFEQYKAFFVADPEVVALGVKSFYVNSNFYGMAMMMAVMAAMIIQVKRYRLYNNFIMIFFIIAGIFSACATTVFASVFIFLAYYIFDVVIGIRKNPKVTAIRVLITLTSCFVLFIAILALYSQEVTFFRKSIDFCISRYINEGDQGFMSFESRQIVWDSAWAVILDNPSSIIFGSGFKTGSWLVHSYVDSASGGSLNKYDILTSHSAFLELWVRYGFLGVLCYVGLLIDFLASIGYLFKKKEIKFAFIFLLCFISIFIHGITESTFFFEGNAKGITITLLFFIPPLSMRHRYHFSGKKELLFYRNMSETKLNINLITRVMANTLLMIFLGSVTVLFTHTVYVRKLAYIFIILAGSSLFLLLLVTPLIHHWGAHVKFKESFKMVIRCSFLSNLLNFFITLIIGGFFAIILSHLLLPSVLTILFIMFANMSIYFALLIFIKNDENKLTIDVVNDYLLYRISKTI